MTLGRLGQLEILGLLETLELLAELTTSRLVFYLLLRQRQLEVIANTTMMCKDGIVVGVTELQISLFTIINSNITIEHCRKNPTASVMVDLEFCNSDKVLFAMSPTTVYKLNSYLHKYIWKT